MALTYLDSVMIENPAYFQQLSAAKLSADLLDSFNIVNQNSIKNSNDITNGNNIFTVGLSVQRLSADLLDVTNFSFDNLEETIANTLYVSVSGNDNNTDQALYSQFLLAQGTILKRIQFSFQRIQP